MREATGSKFTRYVIGTLVLLVVLMWVWKWVAVGRVEKRLVREHAEFDAQREELGRRLRAEGDERVEQTLRLMALPLGWAVRTEAIRDDFDQIEEYAMRLVREPRVRRVVLVDPDGTIRISTDRKLQDAPALQFYGDLAGQGEITLRESESGAYHLMVPILGYDSRLASLIVTLDGN